MTSLTNCEFMVKGYHYIEPTDPIRTDSCRLYLDTTIDGEECEINDGDYSYIGYYIKGWADGHVDGYDKINFQGFLPKNINSYFSGYIYIKNLDGTNFSNDYYFRYLSGDVVIEFPSGTIAPGGRIYENIFENKTDDITGSYSFIDQFDAEYNFTISAVEYGDLLRLSETVTLTSANSQEIIEELTPDQNNLIWNLTLPLDSDSSRIAYLYNQQWSTGVSLQQNESGETESCSWSYTATTREFILTYNQWEESYTAPYVRYYVINNYLAHLKGIHGFYVQT